MNNAIEKKKEVSLSIQGICKSFSSVKVLKGVSLDVLKGEVHALVGENGAGKSTLMNIISGVLPANEGGIFLEGNEMRFKNPDDAQRAGIGFVHQELALCPHVTVAENIFIHRLPARGGIVDRNQLNKMAEQALEPFHSNIHPGQKVADLSVAEQQVVEIAKALSLNCKVLILDEPTSSLNEAEAEALFRIIADIKEKGISVLYISHKLSEIFQICDRVTALRDGLLIGTHEVKDVSAESIVSEMVGKALTSLYPSKSKKIEGPLLEVEGFSGSNRFKDVSFHLNKGEILGLSGLVGAGRSEVVRAVCGIDRSEKGNVKMNGKPVKIRNYAEAIRSGICYLTEDRKLDGLFLKMSITKNLIAIIVKKISKNAIVSEKKAYKLTMEYKEKLNIKFEDPNQPIGSLSGGNQQKVLIAKLLVSSPKIIIMDEPTRGIDVGAKSEIHNMLRKLCDSGVGIIVISSELPEIVGLCDRVMVMHEGRMVGELAGDDITQDNIIANISVSNT